MPTEDQLRDHLVQLVDARCVDPLEILLQDADIAANLRARIRECADAWARAMLDADEDTARQTIIRTIAALYPSDRPFDPPADWWRTPLGQVAARRVGHPTADRVPYSVAGAMLGISRQGVHDLITRGKLARHPDGGVTPASVRERLRHQPG